MTADLHLIGKATGLLAAPAAYVTAQVAETAANPVIPDWIDASVAGLAVLSLVYLVREIISGRLVSRATLEDVSKAAVDRALEAARDEIKSLGDEAWLRDLKARK